MPRLVWSPEAKLDLARLHQFLAPMSVGVANRAIVAIRDGLRILKKYPEAGRPVPELDQGYRELFIGFGRAGYVALYRADARVVVILAIRHGREDGF